MLNYPPLFRISVSNVVTCLKNLNEILRTSCMHYIHVPILIYDVEWI